MFDSIGKLALKTPITKPFVVKAIPTVKIYAMIPTMKVPGYINFSLFILVLDKI